MTSLQTSIKQNSTDTGYFVPLTDIRTTIYAYNATAGQVTFSSAVWAANPAGSGAGVYSTLVASAGAGVLKDMGKTVVSSLRTFRKVQLVVPNSVSTFGVAGRVSTTPTEDYLTGYIELGFEGAGTPAKVAQFGR
jgi:hypothetical protein